MRIGIDIDDTITNTYDDVLVMHSKKYGYDLDKLRNDKLDYEGLAKICPDYENFVKSSFDILAQNVSLKEDVVEVINKLKDDGHEIIFVTARTYEEYSDPYKISYDYLKRNNVYFDKLIVDARDKGQVCVDENINIFIDDFDFNCKKILARNIETLQFDTCFTPSVDGVRRVYSWNEVYEIINSKVVDEEE